MANKTITQLDAAQSLNDNMVIAVQDTNTTYKTTLADVKAYCGGGSGGDAYKVGDRVTDDSDNPVGTVSSIFTDGNGDRYAVVCLDAVNRLASGTWCSSQTTVTDLPIYSTAKWGPWEAKETATYNTQKILDFCTTNGYTSGACSHCRSKSFTIDGTTYYGQLPNMTELNDIQRNHTAINTADPTAGSYSSVNFSTGRNGWSSSQHSSGNAFLVGESGGVSYNNKTTAFGVIPVLEIPLDSNANSIGSGVVDTDDFE